MIRAVHLAWLRLHLYLVHAELADSERDLRFALEAGDAEGAAYIDEFFIEPLNEARDELTRRINALSPIPTAKGIA